MTFQLLQLLKWLFFLLKLFLFCCQNLLGIFEWSLCWVLLTPVRKGKRSFGDAVISCIISHHLIRSHTYHVEEVEAQCTLDAAGTLLQWGNQNTKKTNSLQALSTPPKWRNQNDSCCFHRREGYSWVQYLLPIPPH